MKRFPLVWFFVAGSSIAAVYQDLTLIEHAARQWLSDQLAQQPGKSSFDISPLDRALKLAPCKTFNIQQRPGVRLLGRAVLSVQCIQDARWSVNVIAMIRVHARYYVATRSLPAGHVLEMADIAPKDGELAPLSGSIVLDAAHILGRVLNTPLVIGTPIRADVLRAQTIIQQNQRVKVLFRSGAMEVSNQGKALNQAPLGGLVRVQIQHGKIVQGIANAQGIVEVVH